MECVPVLGARRPSAVHPRHQRFQGQALPLAVDTAVPHPPLAFPGQATDLLFLCGPKKTARLLGGLEAPHLMRAAEPVDKYLSCCSLRGNSEVSSTQPPRGSGDTEPTPAAVAPSHHTPMPAFFRLLLPHACTHVLIAGSALGRPEGQQRGLRRLTGSHSARALVTREALCVPERHPPPALPQVRAAPRGGLSLWSAQASPRTRKTLESKEKSNLSII